MPPEEPVAIVDLINDETGLEDDHVGDHGIVGRIGIFGDVEILLDDAPRVGEERPVSADPGAVFVRFDDAVGADRDKAAIGDLELAVEHEKSFRLPAILGAVTATAEDEHHRMLPLQVRKLSALPGVVGKLVVWKDRP